MHWAMSYTPKVVKGKDQPPWLRVPTHRAGLTALFPHLGRESASVAWIATRTQDARWDSWQVSTPWRTQIRIIFWSPGTPLAVPCYPCHNSMLAAKNPADWLGGSEGVSAWLHMGYKLQATAMSRFDLAVGRGIQMTHHG